LGGLLEGELSRKFQSENANQIVAGGQARSGVNVVSFNVQLTACLTSFASLASSALVSFFSVKAMGHIGAVVELRAVVEAEHRVPLPELRGVAEEADDLAVLVRVRGTYAASRELQRSGGLAMRGLDALTGI